MESRGYAGEVEGAPGGTKQVTGVEPTRGGMIGGARCRRPVLPASVVQRPSTVAGLVATPPGSLVVVTAPAGYGKTIVAAQWDLADPRPFAWVNLDRLDDDPAYLVAHIATALADRSLLDTEDLRFLSSPGRSPDIDLVPALLEILDHSEPFVLVFDDVHRVTDERAQATLAAVVAGASGAGVLALVSRSGPPMSLGRRRLEGTVVELGAEQLALQLDEARRVFELLATPLPDEALTEVLDRCEGWAGGVHLSALAIREGGLDAAAAPVTGRNRLLADYLVEEVLAGLDDSTAHFLEEASILEPMSAGLLDLVLGRQDSGAMLARIEASGNLFLVPLDQERTWYRFHHLFGELLTDRLRRRDPERLRALHRRASACFEADGDLDLAIHHAVAAGDSGLAAALVNRDAVSLVFAGRPGVVSRRLSMLDRAALASADGALATAWASLAEADAASVRAAMEAARVAGHTGPLSDGSMSVDAALALLAGFMGDGGLEGVLRNTRFVVEAGPPGVNPWWGMAKTIEATALIQLGRDADARAALVAAVEETYVVPGVEAAAALLLAWLNLRERDLVGAARHAEHGRRLADGHQLQHVVPLLVVYATDSVVAARSGDRLRARHSIAVVNQSLGRLGPHSPRTNVFGHLLLADAEHALQDGAEARRHLNEARRTLRDHPLSPALAAEADRIASLLDQGPAGSSVGITPLTPAERRVLPLLATHLSLPQIASELHVSRNTVKTHCVALYRKLGASSRTEAVAEARRLGLIDA